MEPSLADFREAAELRAALRKFFRASERVAREEGLTPSRFMLLLMIKTTAAGRSTVTELAERMQLTQSTVTELVTRAEAAGLVRADAVGAGRARVLAASSTPVGNERWHARSRATARERNRLLRSMHPAASACTRLKPLRHGGGAERVRARFLVQEAAHVDREGREEHDRLLGGHCHPRELLVGER